MPPRPVHQFQHSDFNIHDFIDFNTGGLLTTYDDDDAIAEATEEASVMWWYTIPMAAAATTDGWSFLELKDGPSKNVTMVSFKYQYYDGEV